MDLNQIAANLNIVTSVVHRLNVNCNMYRITDNNNREFCLDIKYNKLPESGNTRFGKLLMQINVSVFQDNVELPPDTFELVIEGVFTSSAELSEDEFMELLNVNGGAALYSIARSKIEAFSSLVYADGKVLLPMVNIVQYYQERNTGEE